MSNRFTRRLLVDPVERALQRQLFLEEQCSLQTDLEDLIRTVEEEPFSVIAGELAAYVDNVVDDYSPLLTLLIHFSMIRLFALYMMPYNFTNQSLLEK